MPNLTNLKNLLKERGKSEELSKHTGISSGNISDWKSGRSKPGLESLLKIANHFDCSVDYLLDRTDVKNINTRPITIYRFPVYEQSAAAGVGQLGRDSNYIMEDYLIDNIPDNAVFAMKIEGNSMYNEETGYIKEQSTVLINPKETDYEGKIVIANLDGECVCKRYTTVDDHVEFKSDNEKRQDENKDSRDYHMPSVIGVVIGVIEDGKFIGVR